MSLLMVVCLGMIESKMALDTEYRTSFFYVIPVMLVAWNTDVMLALAMGVLSACVWLLAKHLFSGGFSTNKVLWWNGVTISSYFLIIGYLIAKWRQTIQKIASLATTDPLTGALNTREFYAHLQKEITRANRYGRSFSLAYLDLDDFKAINDRFGHAAGDLLLQRVTDAIKSSIRSSDIIGRLGGDEFAILFPETSQLAVEQIINKILAKLSSHCRIESRQVTFSAGMVTCLGSAPPMGELMNCLDRLMYDSKKNGKDSVRYEIVTHHTDGSRT